MLIETAQKLWYNIEEYCRRDCRIIKNEKIFLLFLIIYTAIFTSLHFCALCANTSSIVFTFSRVLFYERSTNEKWFDDVHNSLDRRVNLDIVAIDEVCLMIISFFLNHRSYNVVVKEELIVLNNVGASNVPQLSNN